MKFKPLGNRKFKKIIDTTFRKRNLLLISVKLNKLEVYTNHQIA